MHLATRSDIGFCLLYTYHEFVALIGAVLGLESLLVVSQPKFIENYQNLSLGVLRFEKGVLIYRLNFVCVGGGDSDGI